jgi:hypothetical protein
MKRLLFRVIAILLAFALGLTGCAKSVVTVPEYRNFAPPPTQVTVEELWADYTSDVVAADTKYKGNNNYRNLLTDITDDNGTSQFLVESLVAGSVKFELRDFNLQQNIEAGFVLNNVVGECRGLLGGFIVIRDSSVDSIQGDIGPIEEISDY